uniref:Coiled-coil domain-containing protein 93 n=1 Tax=Diabrotica virgifera virgifera TaxID=50390 RepID=A0A6P7F8X4_DIAVI
MSSAVNQEVYKKFKNARKLLSTDSTDSTVQVDVREDEEQLIKLQEIIDILVAAGYFRARIKGLSAFDKVVGGMVWCIESCNVELDVDLLFRENLSIGQKIALTEKIVAVLPKIKCPRSIEPHQIQGLDFIHIFPVIQWLVKRSLECREEVAAFVRACAIEQFNKKFHSPDQNQENVNLLKNMKLLSEVYRPRRYYKKKNSAPTSTLSQIQSTLLEYGHSDGGVGDYSMFTAKDKEGSDDQEFVDLDDEHKEQLIKHYTSLQFELTSGAGVQSRDQLLIASLEEKKQLFTEKCKEFKINKASLDSDIKSKAKVLQELESKQKEAEVALKELSQEELESSKVKEIEELIMLNDDLKTQETQFKEQCKKELSNLNNQIQNVKNAKVNIPVENPSVVMSELNELSEKNASMRMKLAKVNRDVAILHRQIDDIPKRAELAQYQKRFVELYNQVAVKHKETKQYYTLYNTLLDTRVYMEKELSLLNSISDSYPEAMKSSKGKDEFLEQFQNIVENVCQSKLKAEQKLNREKQTRDQLSTALHVLVEHQRRYATAIKQLGLEYRKHEMLIKSKE